MTLPDTAETLARLTGASGRKLAIERLDRRAFARILGESAVHQGVAGLVAPLTAPSLGSVLDTAATARHATPILLFLDQVTDPHNVGAVLRSAAAFQVTATIVTARHAPAESGALAKAASGALDTVAMIPVANLATALRRAAAAGFWLLGLDPAGPRSLATAKPEGPTGLVLGAEGAGLRRLTREICDELVQLPIGPAMPSLNVSNSAAIALYELRRPPNPAG